MKYTWLDIEKYVLLYLCAVLEKHNIQFESYEHFKEHYERCNLILSDQKETIGIIQYLTLTGLINVMKYEIQDRYLVLSALSVPYPAQTWDLKNKKLYALQI